jgi:hypothetical protein
LTFVVLVAGLMLVGCGSGSQAPKYVIKGNVTLDGKPLESGRIDLTPTDDKGTTAGGEIKNGKYEVRILFGPKTVRIISEKIVGKIKMDPNDPQSAEGDVKEQIIPARYNTNTELKVDVQEKSPTIQNFDLVSDQPAKT